MSTNNAMIATTNQSTNQPSDDKESQHVEKQKNYPTKMLP